MKGLVLTYHQDDAPNRSGDLGVEIRTRGFTASTRSYVGELAMLNFVERLRVYPLPVEGVSVDAFEFDLSVVPDGSRGHLMVTVYVSDHLGLEGGTGKQEATLRFGTDYASLDTFGLAVKKMLENGDGEATLASSTG